MRSSKTFVIIGFIFTVIFLTALSKSNATKHFVPKSKPKPSTNYSPEQYVPGLTPELNAKLSKYRRENATFVTLARNEDLEGLLPAIRSVQDRFNSRYHYDWVFLNEKEFSGDFKKLTSRLISGDVKYGIINKTHWSYPEWIDQEKAAQERKKLHDEKVMYADNENYRHMCRFESGFFFQHPLLQEYKYYWRVEPDTALYCDIDYDVFRFMSENKKKYGWTLSITEYEKTITTLWNTTKSFLKQYPQYIEKDNLQNFISDDDLETYNLCHYWSNFEVADMDFWRSQPYQDYFNYLDQAGGFFYERWGDAPVHSIAASLFLKKDEVHLFDDIGYSHKPFIHCPADQEKKGLTCSCMPDKSFDWHKSSCLRNYLRANKIEFDEEFNKKKKT